MQDCRACGGRHDPETHAAVERVHALFRADLLRRIEPVARGKVGKNMPRFGSLNGNGNGATLVSNGNANGGGKHASKLTDEQRQTIVKRHGAGDPASVIAADLGLPVATVHAYLRRYHASFVA